MYIDDARARAEALRQSGSAVILAIETSCDETSAAVIRAGRDILSNVVATQIPLHRRFGGVVPEIASRAHVESINTVIDQAIGEAGTTLDAVDAIAVTAGPGLVGALLIGVNTAKALAFALRKPLIPVHHIDAHISANYLAHLRLEPPFVCLIVSGGHSHIALCEAYGEYRLLGQTLDDAAGEAFDKAARVLGLPYPGGPALDALAEGGNAGALTLPRAKTEGEYNFSFSGLKTAFIQLKRKGVLDAVRPEDAAASFREAVCQPLVGKTIAAAREANGDRGERLPVALAGGVAANARLRELFAAETTRRGMRMYMPPLSLCTDNAAMVGSAAYYQLMRGNIADMTLNAEPNRALAAI